MQGRAVRGPRVLGLRAGDKRGIYVASARGSTSETCPLACMDFAVQITRSTGAAWLDEVRDHAQIDNSSFTGEQTRYGNVPPPAVNSCTGM